MWSLIEFVTIYLSCIVEESYFTKLIEHLIQSVRSDDLSAYLKRKKKTVLCNLCYKSVAAVREFQRVMKYKELMNATQDEPIHYAKICLCFARADFTIFQNELELNLNKRSTLKIILFIQENVCQNK